MVSAYLDHLSYLRSPNGLIVSGYVGNSARLSSSTVLGATSLSIMPATTADLKQYDQITIFDGPNSEVVVVNADTAFPATSIPLASGTLFAHAAGVPLCSDGAQGSLAQQILTASQWVEDICHTSLWQTTYTGEVLRMPSMRASIDNQRGLNFKPRHVPVTAIAALTIQTTANVSISYDPTQAIIDSGLEMVSVPNLQGLPGNSQGSGPYLPGRPQMARQQQAWLSVTYTAGYATGALPYPVQRACALLTSQCFVQLYNPIGSDQLQEGERNIVFTMRGDTSGESLLVKEAYRLLQPYVVEES